MSAARWRAVYAAVIAAWLAVLVALIWAIPRDEAGTWLWFDPMVQGGWMAWTFPVALFFYTIAGLLILFTLLAIRHPETPRRGILRLETTRGDRLFITLLGAAFINLAWLFFFGAPLTWPLIVSLLYAAAVFRWV